MTIIINEIRAMRAIAQEKAVAHGNSARPTDTLGVADWHCIMARLTSRRDTLDEVIKVMENLS